SGLRACDPAEARVNRCRQDPLTSTSRLGARPQRFRLAPCQRFGSASSRVPMPARSSTSKGRWSSGEIRARTSSWTTSRSRGGHFKLAVENGRVTIAELRFTNGTFVNHVLVVHAQSLSLGTRTHVGPTPLEVGEAASQRQ